MSWNEYDDNEDDFDQDGEDTIDNWEVRFNGEKLDVFETKEDALWCIFDELEQVIDFYDKVEDLGYNDEIELVESLLDMCSTDFYDEFDRIIKFFKIKDVYKIINLDNEEPEFGEL